MSVSYLIGFRKAVIRKDLIDMAKLGDVAASGCISKAGKGSAWNSESSIKSAAAFKLNKYPKTASVCQV